MSRKILLAAICFMAALPINAQNILSSENDVPLDPRVRHGKLNNGFTYYILREENMMGKIECRLIVKAGNLYIAPEDNGIAHLIEHISFRSTQHFPDGLRRGLQNAGIQCGANTVLSTNYLLSIGGGDSLKFRLGLLALHDWAKGRSYHVNEVEEEKAAVLIEFGNEYDVNAGQLSEYLLLDKHPLYDTSRIGHHHKENITNVSIEALRGFDDKWYRPDLQALVIVGDINVATVENEVIKMFSSLQSKSGENLPGQDMFKKFDVPLSGRNKVVVENNGSSGAARRVRIYQKQKAQINVNGPVNRNQLKRMRMYNMYNVLIKRRFETMADQNNISQDRVINVIDRQPIHPMAGIEAIMTNITFNGLGDLRKSITLAMKELLRVESFGFTENELEEAKKTLINALEGEYNNTGFSIGTELLSHFVGNVVFPEKPLELNRNILDEISLKSINTMAREWLKEEKNIDVLLSVPDANANNVPSGDQILGWIQQARSAKVKPFVETEKYSLPKIPIVKNIKFEKKIVNKINATELKFSNGARVIIKSLTDSADQSTQTKGSLVLHAFRKGGLRLYSPDKRASAFIAPALVTASGVSSLHSAAYAKWLNEKNRSGNLSVDPYINYMEEGIYGSCGKPEMEDFLHLLYWYFRKPRIDKNIFERQFPGGVVKRESSGIGYIFMDSVQSVIAGGIPKEITGNVNFNDASQIYRERFSDVKDFTFVITGYFNVDSVINYVIKSIGAIPISKERGEVENKKLPLPVAAFTDRDLRVIMDDKKESDVTIKMLFETNMDYSVRNILLSMITREILAKILHQRLREHEKGTYYATATTQFNITFNKMFLSLQFEPHPDNVERLIKATEDELSKIAAGELHDSVFSNAMHITESEISGDFKSLHYANAALVTELKNETISDDGFRRAEILKTITKQDIIELIRDKLDIKHYRLFKLL